MSEQASNPPPEHLSEAARSHWDKIVREYAIDCAACLILTSTLEAWDLRETARLAIAEQGAVLKDRFGQQKKNPWVEIERDQTLIIQRGFRLLGFDQEPRGGNQGSLSFG